MWASIQREGVVNSETVVHSWLVERREGEAAGLAGAGPRSLEGDGGPLQASNRGQT